MLDSLEESTSHAILEIIVTCFYPSRLVSQELHDATQAWLDANPTAPAALSRLVVENRDPVARALKAQARDAHA
jgi:aminopeptidase N